MKHSLIKPIVNVRNKTVHTASLNLFEYLKANSMAAASGLAVEGFIMPAPKKQRIDLRLSDDDKSAIEEAAAMSNQTITQFMVASASKRAAEVIEQHRRLILNNESWNRVMDAISNPPVLNDRLKRAAKRLKNME